MSKGKRRRRPSSQQPVEEATAPAPSPTFGRKQLGVLLIFALGFVALLVGYLLFKGDDPRAPMAVATIKGANDYTRTISDAEVKRAVERKSKRPLRVVPQLGNKHLEDLQAAVLSELLEAIWYREEAQALGVSVTDEEVANKLAQIKAKKYPTEAKYQRYLEDSNLAPQDLEGLIRNELLSAKVKEQAASALSREDQFAGELLFTSEFTEKWKSRTKCAPGFLNMKGSGGLQGAGYILEQYCPGASEGTNASQEMLERAEHQKAEK